MVINMHDRTITFDGAPLLYWYPKWLRPIVLALFPLLTAASLGLTVWCVLLIFEEPQSVVLSILTVSVTAGGTAFLFWYGWASWIDLCRMVRFSPDGLTEIDPNGKPARSHGMLSLKFVSAIRRSTRKGDVETPLL